MKKVIFSILVFFFNILPIYALTFDMSVVATEMKVKAGTSVSVDVNLVNIKDTASGISSCQLEIAADDGVVIGSNLSTYGNWQYISGVKGYSFDTTDSVLSNTKIFTIPLVVNKSGKLKIANIICTDIDDQQFKTSDKEITFTVVSNASSSSSSGGQSSSSSSSSSQPPSNSKPSSSSQPSSNLPSSSQPSSNASSSSNGGTSSSGSSNSSSSGELNSNLYLADIKVTGGDINFVKDNFEYGIIVNNFDEFAIEPVVENDGDMFDVSESFADDQKKFVITLWNETGDMQKYTLYVIENSKVADNSSSSAVVSKDDKDYSGIFIAIIVVLILINVGRVGYKLYKQEIKKL